jgi:hypothetical protein
MKARPTLDDYVSIHCFKAVITGMEDILGPEGTTSAMIAAGRKRGIAVATEAGFRGSNPAVDTLVPVVNKIIGLEGTRLCIVKEISATPEGGYYVKSEEAVCTSGEPAGSNRLPTYTLGALIGFLETAYGTPLKGSVVAPSTQGSVTDDFLIVPV